MFRPILERNRGLSLILFFVVLIPGLFYPFIGLLKLAFAGSFHQLFQPMGAVFGGRAFWAAAKMSLKISIESTLLVGLIGVFVAMVLHFWPFRGSGIIVRVTELMAAFPSFLVAFSLIYLYGTRGAATVGIQHLFHLQRPPFDFLYSQTGIIIAEVSYYLPFMIRPTLSVLEMLDNRLLEAASSLGANPFSLWRRIVMPLALPGITAGFILCFLLVLNEFGVLLVLGSQTTPTIPISIYNEAMINLNLPAASIEALAMIVLVCILYGTYRMLSARALGPGAGALQLHKHEVSHRSSPIGRFAGTSVGGIVTVIFVLPIVVIALSSIAKSWVGTVLPKSYTLRWLTQLGPDDWHAVSTTLFTSTAVAVIALTLGTWAAMLTRKRQDFWSNVLDAVLMFPMAVPSVVIGLAILLAYHTPPLDLSNSGGIVVFAQTLLVLPTCYRTMVASVEKIPLAYAEAAAGLGTPPWRVTLRVTLPLLLPALRAGFALAFALSAGELGATLMVYPAGFVTGPVQVMTYVQRGYYSQGSALAIVLLLATFGCLCLISLVRPLHFRARPSARLTLVGLKPKNLQRKVSDR